MIAFAVLVIFLSTRPPASGCTQSLEVTTEGKFNFTQECINEISEAAKEATLKTGASEEVADAAGEAAAEASRNTFESSSPSSIAQEIAIDTMLAVNEEAVVQGGNTTEATRAANAAGAAAAITVLGAASPDAAEFVASVANASSSDPT